MTGPGSHAVIGRSSQVGVTVGLVGPDSFVPGTIDLARQLGHSALRLLPAMYSSIARIGYAVEKDLGQVESIRFAGPAVTWPLPPSRESESAGRPDVPAPRPAAEGYNTSVQAAPMNRP